LLPDELGGPGKSNYYLMTGAQDSSKRPHIAHSFPYFLLPRSVVISGQRL